jgi:hypothetical protein
MFQALVGSGAHQHEVVALPGEMISDTQVQLKVFCGSTGITD